MLKINVQSSYATDLPTLKSQNKIIPSSSLTPLKKDTVSFKGNKTEFDRSKPYLIDSFTSQLVMIPNGFNTEKKLITPYQIQTAKGSTLSEAVCSKSAIVKGEIGKLTINLELVDNNSLIVSKHGVIKELNLETPVYRNRFVPYNTFEGQCVHDGEKYFNNIFRLDINKDAINNPQNFQKITINGQEISREDFINLTKPHNEPVLLNDIYFYGKKPIIDSLLDIFKPEPKSKYIKENLIILEDNENPEEVKKKNPGAIILPEEGSDDYFRLKVKHKDELSHFQEVLDKEKTQLKNRSSDIQENKPDNIRRNDLYTLVDI